MADTFDKLMSGLQKAYGKQKVFPASVLPPVTKIPTKNPGFDYVATGGIPINRIIEFIGPESSTKTYHAMLAAIAFQFTDWDTITPGAIQSIEWTTSTPDKSGYIMTTVKSVKAASRRSKTPKVKRVVWIDTEGTFDPEWAAYVGVDVDGLLYYQPDSLNEAVDIAQAFLSHPDVCLVIFDSMSAVGASAEMDESMEKEQMGVNARFWNKAVRKFQSALNKNEGKHTTLIAINTFTTKLGIMFGNPESPRNGNQIKYAKSLSIEFRPLKVIEDEGYEGRNINVRNLKSKVGQPFRRASFFFSLDPNNAAMYGRIDKVAALRDLAIQFGIVSKSGAWYTYKDVRSQGVETFREDLIKKGAVESLEKEVYAKF